MIRHSLKLLGLLALVILVPCAALAGEAVTGGLHLHSCAIGPSKVPAKCGRFEVYEDTERRVGRRIALRFILLLAKQPSRQAIYWNPGGPGAATLPFAAEIADGRVAAELSALRDRYNILLLDNRGMGGSHTLDCRLNEPKDRAAYFRQIWPDTLLSACRAAHARNSDLSRYTTADAIDDLDRLRAALGFPRLVLDGDSYGTYFALEFMRLHPGRVESAILDGVAPPHFMVLPLEDAVGAQLGMESLADTCRQDLACQARFPDFAGQFEELVKRFDQGSVDVPVTDEKTGRRERVALSKEVFAERLRQTLYDPGVAAYIPFVVERAHEGDYGPLATMIDLESRTLGRVIEAGANLSYACAEQVPFIPEDQVAASSAGSFLGDARVRAEQHACALWDVRTAPAEAYAPVRSDLPVLMVSGTDDPTTPARYAEAQLALLPHARRVLVKGASHVTEIPCTIRAKVDFVRAESAEGLDLAACSSAFERPPFATSMDGFAAFMSSM